MQAAIERVWPYLSELFADDDVSLAFVSNESLRPAFDAFVHGVLVEATLTVPETTWAPSGGRQGLHTEHLGYLLAEMQYLHRAHPGVTW
jgi:ring-1,2-phenylacetyl-CoA epoxidase subunit PaaC